MLSTSGLSCDDADGNNFLLWNSCNKCTIMLTLQLACSLNSRIAYILKLQQPPVTANISSEHFAWAVVEVEYNTLSQVFYHVFHSPSPMRFWWWDWFLKAVLCGLYKMAGVTGKINHPVMCAESVYGSVSHWVAGKVIFMQFVGFVNNLGSIWYTASHSHVTTCDYSPESGVQLLSSKSMSGIVATTAWRLDW